MRRLILFLILSVSLTTACKRRATAENAPPEAPAELLSAFEISDPRAAVQLTRGFYGLEGNSWRWTARQFGVVLAPTPAGPARLELKLNVPEVILQRVGPITLSATFNAEPLPPETFTTAGEHTYTRAIPAAALSGRPVAIEFTADKALPPSGDDTRELALIVTAVGLTPQ